MKRGVGVALLAVIVTSPAFSKSKHCTVRVHLEANARDGSVFASPVTTPISGRSIFIEKIPSISERDINAFRSYPASDGTFGTLLQLDEHGKLALETISTENRGSTVVVLVNGRAVNEWVIDRRVSDGRLYIASGLSAGDIQLMARDWPEIGAKQGR